jgi:lipoprotein NlpI
MRLCPLLEVGTVVQFFGDPKVPKEINDVRKQHVTLKKTEQKTHQRGIYEILNALRYNRGRAYDQIGCKKSITRDYNRRLFVSPSLNFSQD